MTVKETVGSWMTWKRQWSRTLRWWWPSARTTVGRCRIQTRTTRTPTEPSGEGALPGLVRQASPKRYLLFKALWYFNQLQRKLKVVFTGIPGFITLLHVIGIPFFFFKQIEPLWPPWVGTPISTTFPTAFTHFASLCHILVILSIFHTCSLLLCLLGWSMFSKLWGYCCNCLGAPQTMPI